MYCRAAGVDKKIERFIRPDYYTENVELSKLDNDRIKQLISRVDDQIQYADCKISNRSSKKSLLSTRETKPDVE